MNATNRKYAEFFNERIGSVLDRSNLLKAFGVEDKLRPTTRLPNSLAGFCSRHITKGSLKKLGLCKYKVMREIKIKRKDNSYLNIPVLKLDSEGNQVGSFSSIADASGECGLPSWVIGGSVKASESGFRWELDTKSKSI